MSTEPEDGGDISPAQARAALTTVAEFEGELEWQPTRWVVAVLASYFALYVAMITWENFWVLALLPIVGLFGFLFRRKLFNPYVRERPQQQLVGGEKLSAKEWFLRHGVALWIPVVIVLPGEPRIFGLIVGVLAGAHAYYLGMNLARTTAGTR